MKIRKQLPNVVAAVNQQTSEAAELARIAGQDRLTDPRTNPAVRALLDHLRDEQHRMLLEAEHGRAKRRHRVDDRHRSEAELTLQAILQAKQASSPARSVLALHRGRTLFMGGSLTASVALSVGSAFGVGHLADELGAPKVTGWVAEVGMVGLSTIVILYLAHLFRHGWAPSTPHRFLLGFLAIGPLLASVVANAFGAGPVGVACSVGAALFGVFSHLVSDNSAGALRRKADEVGREDERALRATVLGDDLFAAPTKPERAEETAPPTGSALAIGSLTGPVTVRLNRSETDGSDPTGSGPADRSETSQTHGSQTQVPDPPGDRSETHSPDRSDPKVPDQVSDQTRDQVPPGRSQTRKTRTGPKKQTRSKTKPKAKPLDRIDEARAADSAYLADHGRHIPAEKLARALSIGKPAALELVKQVRGGHIDIAK